jgi:hypothetical protein
MGKFEEYEFDVTRLWDAPSPPSTDRKNVRLTKRARTPRDPTNKLVAFPRPSKNSSSPNTFDEAAARLALAALLPGPGASGKAVKRCRKRISKTIAELRESPCAPGAPSDANPIADAAERWIGAACSACGRCLKH